MRGSTTRMFVYLRLWRHSGPRQQPRWQHVVSLKSSWSAGDLEPLWAHHRRTSEDAQQRRGRQRSLQSSIEFQQPDLLRLIKTLKTKQSLTQQNMIDSELAYISHRPQEPMQESQRLRNVPTSMMRSSSLARLWGVAFPTARKLIVNGAF